MDRYVDVTPLQDPLPSSYAELNIPGLKPLIVSVADYQAFCNLCSQELVGRKVEMSGCPDNDVQIRFRLILD
jgi:hypothetical protein